MNDQRKEIRLDAGTVRYREAGEGPTIVFVHGFLVDGRLWDGVVDRLADRFRCIAPDWPIGAQQIAMDPDADLTPPGLVATIAELLAKLELEDVTIVGNDSGGAMSQILVTTHPERISRLVLTNCDTHDNFPPGIFKLLPPLIKLPGGMAALTLPFRSEKIARLAFKPFSKRGIPDQLVASWMEPARHDPAVKRDVRKVVADMHRRYTEAAMAKLRASDLPILLTWAPEDKLFPIALAERIEREVPGARLVRIPDASTFVPLDQPQRLADEIAQFATTA